MFSSRRRTSLATLWLAAVALVGPTLANGDDRAASTGPASSAAPTAYPWPLKPFDRPHPVRAVVGDPRTVFGPGVHGDPLAGPGHFSFHNGVDIDAPNGTAVYPVVSGFVRGISPGHDGVLVASDDGRFFDYEHIVPAVTVGRRVTARQTVLGRVRFWSEHLHFSEFAGGSIVDPLLSGHLTPYTDTTKPAVTAVRFLDDHGKDVPPFAVRGQIAIVAEAHDVPADLDSEAYGYRSTRYAWDRFPVVPAAVTWSVARLHGDTVVSPTTVVDFRQRVPSNDSFWDVYARGTYQNRAQIGNRTHSGMPGRYLFLLTPSLDTRELPDGVYVVTVTAVDVRGNSASVEARMEISNGGGRTTAGKDRQ